MTTTSEPEFFQVRVCAWCKTSLPKVACEPAFAGQISHGYCKPCADRELADLAIYNAKKGRRVAA